MCPRAKVARCRTVVGERVCVSGLLTWVNERGELQLVAEEVIPVGAGAVAAMVAESRRRLAADGLLERPRRTLPRLPELIGVVCGADAAVRKDIESVVTARFPGYPVDFAETVLSGPGAAVSILSAVESLVQRPGMAVIILARGGGDPTQLLPVSDEDLCRAIAACPVPVVSASATKATVPSVTKWPTCASGRRRWPWPRWCRTTPDWRASWSSCGSGRPGRSDGSRRSLSGDWEPSTRARRPDPASPWPRGVWATRPISSPL